MKTIKSKEFIPNCIVADKENNTIDLCQTIDKYKILRMTYYRCWYKCDERDEETGNILYSYDKYEDIRDKNVYFFEENFSC